MAIVRPFKAIRPRPELAEQVVSLPYDVMDRKEAAAMAENNPISFLHICRAEIDLPEEDNPYDDSVYQKARENLDRFLEEGVFQQEEEATYYFYRQTMGQNIQTGIVGCVSIDEYMDNIIKKHEHTREEKELDRIRHFDVCNANTEPVFLTMRRDEELNQLTEEYVKTHPAEFQFTSKDGVGHSFWVVADKNVRNQITNIFKKIPSLYIADGHHRSASACKVGVKRREENGDYTGAEEFNYFMAVIFPDQELHIYDYNRLVKDLNGLSPQQFLSAVKTAGFSVTEQENGSYRPAAKHTFGMYLDGRWYELIASPEIIVDHPIDGLDVSVLQNHLLAPILGIQNPRTDKRIDFVGGIRGLEELERRVSTDMRIAFALYPVTISDLLLVSDSGLVMPPKSTWFEPKLGSGLFIHRL